MRPLGATICILLLAAIPLAAGARSHSYGRSHSYSQRYSYKSAHSRDRTSTLPRAERSYIPVEPLPLSVRCGYRLRDWRGRYIRCSAAGPPSRKTTPVPPPASRAGPVPAMWSTTLSP